MKFAVGEVRADVADVAAALADEDREPAPRCCGITCRCDAIAARERVAKIVERRASGAERLLVRRKRLGDVDGDALRRRRGARCRSCRGSADAALRRLGPACAIRARSPPISFDVEYRPQALRPQAVAGAIPAEPVLQARVGDADRVAIDRDAKPAARGRPSVNARAGWWHVAQAMLARARQSRVAKQHRAERDRIGVAGDAIGRIGLPWRRPGPCARTRARRRRRRAARSSSGCASAARRNDAAPPIAHRVTRVAVSLELRSWRPAARFRRRSRRRSESPSVPACGTSVRRRGTGRRRAPRRPAGSSCRADVRA